MRVLQGDTTATAFVDGVSYVDQNDDPVGLIVVPEPRSFLLVALGLLLLATPICGTSCAPAAQTKSRLLVAQMASNRSSVRQHE
jgi:hypothetical protein